MNGPYTPFPIALFASANILWLLEFIYRPGHVFSQGLSSFRLVSAAILLSIVGSVLFRFLLFVTLEGFELDVALCLGIAFAWSGSLRRLWAILVLGDRFTRGIEAHRELVLATTGPYRFLRHPLHLGLFLLTMGTALFTGTYFGILLTAVLMSVALRARIAAEESALRDALGERYRIWRTDRW